MFMCFNFWNILKVCILNTNDLIWKQNSVSRSTSNLVDLSSVIYSFLLIANIINLGGIRLSDAHGLLVFKPCCTKHFIKTLSCQICGDNNFLLNKWQHRQHFLFLCSCIFLTLWFQIVVHFGLSLSNSEIKTCCQIFFGKIINIHKMSYYPSTIHSKLFMTWL